MLFYFKHLLLFHVCKLIDVFHFLFIHCIVVVALLLLSVSSGVRLAVVTALFCSSFSSHFSNCVLYHKCPTSSIFCCCSSFSSHSFQISLNAVLPSHSRLSTPPFPLHILSISLPIVHLPFLPLVRPISFYPHQFLLKTFHHSNLHSQFVHSSLTRSLHFHDSSYPVAFANLHFLLLFHNRYLSIIPIVTYFMSI